MPQCCGYLLESNHPTQEEGSSRELAWSHYITQIPTPIPPECIWALSSLSQMKVSVWEDSYGRFLWNNKVAGLKSTYVALIVCTWWQHEKYEREIVICTCSRIHRKRFNQSRTCLISRTSNRFAVEGHILYLAYQILERLKAKKTC